MPGTRDRAAWIAAALVVAAALPAFGQDTARAEQRRGSRYAQPVTATAKDARILFTENAGLFAMRADGSEVKRLLPPGAECVTASWSPDGSEVVFVGRMDLSLDLRGPGIYVVGADGSGLRKIAATRGFVTRPSWSPASTFEGEHVIVFSDAVGDSEHNYDLFAVRPDGTGLRNLTQTDDVKETYPTWSPDASRVAFVATYTRDLEPTRRRFRNSRNVDERRERCVQDVMVSRLVRDAEGLLLVEPENVTDVRGSELAFDRKSEESHRFESLTWSGHDERLAVVAALAPERLQSDVWLIDLDQPKKARNVTHTPWASEEAVSWAPDGSHLLYFRHDIESDAPGMYVVSLGRRGKALLLQATAHRSPADWQGVAPPHTSPEAPAVPDVHVRPTSPDLGGEAPR